MVRKVLVSVADLHVNNAGPKARTDIEDVLEQDGYELWKLPFNYESKIKKLKYKYWDIPRLFKGQKIDEVYFQYPIYSTVLMDQMMAEIQAVGSKLIFIVHDIESLRLFKGQAYYAAKEVEWLNQADGLIVHSQAMQDYLRERGVTTPMVILGVFDYLNPQPMQALQPYRRSLCFAGNLAKSQFLSRVNFNDKVPFQVFGPNPLADFPKEVDYQGLYSPEELPKHLTANFGLVWDGSRTDTCDGDYGKYMQYNSPHKVSLYLSTGIPVIVWKQAAVAKYITENGLGLAIDSLDNLPARLAQLSLADYQVMKSQVEQVAKSLLAGLQIKRAIKALHEQLTVADEKRQGE